MIYATSSESAIKQTVENLSAGYVGLDFKRPCHANQPFGIGHVSWTAKARRGWWPSFAARLLRAVSGGR
jgi:hypothetical protein